MSADVSALRLPEGVSHAASDDKRIALFQQIGNNVELVCDLCSAEDRNEGVLGMFEGVCHDGEFFFDEEAADGSLNKTVFHDRRRGSMGTVCRSECVVYVNIAEGSEFFAEFKVFLFFFPVEAEIFKEHAFALFERVDLCLCVGTDYVAKKRDFAAEKLVKTLCNGSEAEL